MVIKNYLIAFCFLLSVTSVSSQTTYNKFIVDGAAWVVSENFCAGFGGPCDAGNPGGDMIYANTYYFKLAGDSLIDSTYYARLFVSVCANSCFGCGPPNGPDFYPGCGPYELAALLYEDTINRKVFVHNSYSQSCWNHYDSLFIDFSLAAGDSENLVYNFDYCDTNAFIVDSINNTGFQSYPVKTWFIQNTKNVGQGADFQLFEGIGYSWGFSLMYDGGDGTTSYGRQLIKYCPAGDNSCNSPWRRPNAIAEIPLWNNTIIIKPNPASDLVTINSSDAIVNRVEILDINGKTVGSFNSTQLNVSSLSPAMYFLQIHTNMGISYKRFVKI